MRFSPALRAWIFIGAAMACAVFCSAGQEENPKETQIKGMPARVAPTEYQAHGQAGAITIGAEFMRHSVPTPEHTFTSEDYIVVEAGFFGAAGAHLMLTRDDFSLRVNGKKNTLASEPFELVAKSLKDPEWQPPEDKDAKNSSNSSGGFSAGNGGQTDSAPPPPPKMPFPLRRAMELQVQKAAMDQGDRALPHAGLLFFLYHGKAEGIKSLELIYSGAAGKTTIDLQP